MVTNQIDKKLWSIDKRIRELLHEGVDFGNGHRLIVAVEPDVAWIKVDENGYVTAIYLKGLFGITVRAKLQNGDVEILSASLDCMCQNKGGRVGGL